MHLRETDSTNERARRLALAGAPHGTLVTAGAQTAGRGRQGRSWVAPAGTAVLASLIVRGLDPAAALLPLGAAVAVCEACERSAPVACAIKWPNDVWIDERKVAGILVEGRAQEGWAVIGVGVNVTARARDLPEELRRSATSLGEASGEEPAPEAVLAALVAALERRLGEDPEELIAAWSARDALRGRTIRWEGGEGLAEGIDASGALLVSTGDERRALAAGEVSLVRPRAAG